MRIEGTFLGTRVARRMLFLFILCGVVPSGAAALYAFASVRSELQRNAQELMKEFTKSAAADIMDQLRWLDRRLADAAASFANSMEGAASPVVGLEPAEGLRSLFIQQDVRAQRTTERPATASGFSSKEGKHLAGGRSLLVVREDRDTTRVLLGRLVDPSDPRGALIWAELDPEFLWQPLTSSTRSSLRTELCIFAETGQTLHCTLRDPGGAFSQLRRRLNSGGEAFLDLEEPDGDHLAVPWAMFLGFEFGAGDWTIVASEPRAAVFAPLDNFRKYFALILGLTIAVIFLLANIQIRRTTEPLEELEKATHRVAEGDLDTDVQVASGDEFEDLADSFNAMTHRLQDQFLTLAAMADVDRAVLSSLDLDEIIHTVLMNTQQVTGGAGAGLMLLDLEERWAEAFLVVEDSSRVTHVRQHPIGVEDVAVLRERPQGLTIELEGGDQKRPRLVDLEPFAVAGLKHFWVLPLLEERTLYGALLVGHRRAEQRDPGALLRARQLADQVSVALSNARLVRELNELSDGAITALARTIDAKSTWTAGHSDRVTKMALALGDLLGITVDERTTLRRGGLLHDIGKIGVPPGILDKPGPLTDEEMELMRQHTVTGARILEPIRALADVIPVVLYHHERFDGRGYPHGLAGEGIPRVARILSVADVFDALVSDRPYRKALPLEVAVEIIRDGAGSQFDPDVVRAFMELAAGGEIQERGYDAELALAAS